MVFAAQRTCPWAEIHDSSPRAAPPAARSRLLTEIWDRSAATVAEIQQAICALDELPEVDCIFLTGSLARMEQLDHSDCDLIVITRSPLIADRRSDEQRAADDARLMQQVWTKLLPLRLEPPKADGIYARPVDRQRLIDPATRGQIAEPFDVFGKRIQLLLDGQPVLHPRRFEELRDEVLQWYLEPAPSSGQPDMSSRSGTSHASTEHDPAFLIHDLVRYFHALSLRTMWVSNPVERTRLLWKFDHSRLVCYAGLVSSLATWIDQTSGRLEELAGLLQLTPLERTVHEALRLELDSAPDLVDSYSGYLRRLHELHSTTGPARSERTPAAPAATTGSRPSFRRCIEELFLQGMSCWPDSLRKPLLLP